MAITYSLATTVAPASQPLTTDEVRQHCRVPSDDAAQLAVLGSLLASAVEVVEGRTGLALMPQQFRLRLSAFADVIQLPRPPLVSVQAVKYLDPNGTEQTLATSVYRVHADTVPGTISLAPGKSWPDVEQSLLPVCVEYTAGYASATAVPAKAKQAILLLVSHWFENRGAIIVGTISSETPLAFESLVKQLAVGHDWVM